MKAKNLIVALVLSLVFALSPMTQAFASSDWNCGGRCFGYSITDSYFWINGGNALYFNPNYEQYIEVWESDSNFAFLQFDFYKPGASSPSLTKTFDDPKARHAYFKLSGYYKVRISLKYATSGHHAKGTLSY